ncbi:MAG: ABC transporter permease [Chloroflexi bacterium]|nr:MAG: ABC transporter permease [Chloroflexota bacterium]
MSKALVVFQKEWLELRLQRGLLLATLGVPPAITVFAIVVFALAGHAPGDVVTRGIPLPPDLIGLSSNEIAQAIVGKQFSVIFFLLPVFIPSVIASYAIVGEKRDRTLEPLLATPIRTSQLLVGKSLSALVPTVVLTLACALLFVAGIALWAVTPRVAGVVITPGWVAVLAVDMPLLALIGIALIVIVSSRVNDPRTAQQVSAVLIVPVLGLLFGQLSGVLVLNLPFALLGALVLGFFAFVALRLATDLFGREAILTRWR